MDNEHMPHGKLTPPPEQWKKLLELCNEVMADPCFEMLEDTGVLAIDDPDLGERIVCCVMPRGEGFLARLMFVLRGAEAYQWFTDQFNAAIWEEDVCSLMAGATGVYITGLEWEDLSVAMRQQYKRMGYRRKRQELTPVLTSLRPSRLGAYIYREDVDFLTRALEQCLAMARTAWGPLAEPSDLDESFTLRVRTAETGADGARRWVDRWEPLPEFEGEFMEIRDKDEADRLARDLTLRQDVFWEAEAFYTEVPLPVTSQETEIDQHFMFRLLRHFTLIDPDTPYPLGVHSVLTDSLVDYFQPGFLQALEQAGYLPEGVFTVRGDVYRSLEKLCNRLGIGLHYVNELEIGKTMRESVTESLVEKMVELLEEIGEVQDGEKESLPERLLEEDEMKRKLEQELPPGPEE